VDKPLILCVDDEPQVLEGIQANLRRRFDVRVAAGGPPALALLESGLSPVAIMSDMRMPGMDGATFLARARSVAPEAVRLLLTGQTDLSAAVAAVNEGQIFRFLTKPCPPPALMAALDAAVAQHRLITAERVLLQETLHGCVQTLIDVLSMTNPVAFGRATRIKRRVSELLDRLAPAERWHIEVAAMLSQLAAITLPPETAEKLYFGQLLDPEEHKMVARLPAVTEQLLGHIPRLESVRAILASYPRSPLRGAVDPARASIELGAAVLRVAIDSDALEAQGSSLDVALESLRSRGERYDPAVLDALATELDARHALVVKEVPLAGLRAGMMLVEDLARRDGMLVLARGVELTISALSRLQNFQPGSIREPIRVSWRTGALAAAVGR